MYKHEGDDQERWRWRAEGWCRKAKSKSLVELGYPPGAGGCIRGVRAGGVGLRDLRDIRSCVRQNSEKYFFRFYWLFLPYYRPF